MEERDDRSRQRRSTDCFIASPILFRSRGPYLFVYHPDGLGATHPRMMQSLLCSRMRVTIQGEES